MKEIKSVIVLLRKSKGDGSSYTSDRWRVGAKSEKEAVKIVNEFLKEINLRRKVRAYYIDNSKHTAYKTIVEDIEGVVLK